MLALNDPYWNELASTYGSGANVAELLASAYDGAHLDRWYDDLFQEVLHQYTLSQAAYAAVPHLLAIASKRAEIRKHLTVLVGACFGHATDVDSPAIPSGFEGEWQSARWEALSLTLGVLQEPGLDENDVRYLLASLAALKGHTKLSVAIEALDTGVECPQCGHFIEFMEPGIPWSDPPS